MIWLLAAVSMAQEVTLTQIMADETWMGSPPGWPYWSEDSRDIYFYREVPGEDRYTVWSVGRSSGDPVELAEVDRTDSPTSGGVWDDAHRRRLYSYDNNLYLSDRRGRRTPLTRTHDAEREPMWTADDDVIAYRVGSRWFTRDLGTGLVSQVADVRTGDDPADEDDEDEPDFLDAQQLRLFSTLSEREAHADAARDRDRAVRLADPNRVPPPLYIGADLEIRWSRLAPDLKTMVLVVSDEGGGDGRRDQMPVYVTRSGYVETETLRPKVGERSERAERLLLLDLASREVHPLPLSVLPGISDDPLAAFRDAPEEGERPLQVLDVQYHPAGGALAVQLRAHDNKDRWLAVVDTRAEAPALEPVHRLTDPAWVPWAFDELGWLPDPRREALWWLSEESGYGHLYLREGGAVRQLTEGAYEVSGVQASPDGRYLYHEANAGHPGVYEVWRVDTRGGAPEQVTALGGRNPYTLSPDGDWLLLRHEETTRPGEIYVQRARPGARAEQRTDSLSDAYRAIPWVEPELVEVPSTHGAPPIHGRLYAPADSSGAPRPAVIFIHGAGYMQSAHAGWSYYAHEFMFHTLLVQHGYVVLDLDYRASAGYGRDWRTAIYRQMGTPEVEDLLDGAAWLAQNHNVDRDRVGLYGGSYGGFLTLMALFTQPGAFAAGAALRPVTDWAHYNHGYTANILNTPALDPEAYRRSSPIELAEGLADPLLICHGMMDDNVTVQDVFRLSQRLIELEKEDWELALYPLERHGFTEPDAWLDEYRRIFKLFETHLNNTPPALSQE